MNGAADRPSDTGFNAAIVWRRSLMSAGATILAIVLAALVYLVSVTNDERDAASSRERDSFEIIMLSRNIERSIARSEAALGRFVINSSPELGTLYRDEWRAARRQITELGRLVRGDELQRSRVEQLFGHFNGYGADLSNTANYAAVDRNWEALSLHNTASQSADGAAIHRLLEEIADQERMLLGERSSRRRAMTERSNQLANLLAIAGVLLAIAAAGLAWAAFTAFRARETADLRADDLESAVAARTAELRAVNEELRKEAAERELAERQLRQAQKMEAMGQLTGGIAHDFNNMLAVVIGALELTKRNIDKGSGDIGHHIDSAMEGATRAAELTRRLLAFARAEPLRPEGVDAAAALEEMMGLLRRTLGERVTVSVVAEDDSWPIWADRTQFENAVLNLAVNARDAMEGEGEIKVALSNVSLAAGEIGDAKSGDYLLVAVTDTGCGMDQAVLDRVFEPFFTTKPVGEGTGLGLSQIFGFARESGGEVKIDSRPDQGTTVSLFLPRFEGDTDEHRAAGDAAEQPASHSSAGYVILMVEDDERVRRATHLALEELGHKPIICSNGAEALDMLATRDDVELLMTDVIMPEMTGAELAERVLELHPDLPLLFVTGYAGETDLFEQFGDDELLHKPFTLAKLSAAIGRAMSKAPRSIRQAAE